MIGCDFVIRLDKLRT